MKFKKSVALMVSVIFVATSSMAFAETGNNDTKTLSSVKTVEKMGKDEITVAAIQEVAAVTEEEVVAEEEVVVAEEEVVVAEEEEAVVATEEEAVVATEEVAIGEVVEIEEQPVALAEELKEEVLPEAVLEVVPPVVPEVLPEVLPEIKKEAILKVVTSLKCGAENMIFEEAVNGLFEGDIINIADYVRENEDVMAINGEGTLVLKEGENSIVINYEFRCSSNDTKDESLEYVDPMNC